VLGQPRLRQPVKPQCGTSKSCEACTSNGGCAGHVGTAFCDSVLGSPTVDRCVQCLTNADCTDPSKPTCDVSTSSANYHKCVPCVDDNGCTGHTGLACQPGGTCGQCSESNQVACTGGTPACNVQTGNCALCAVAFGDLGANSTACVSSTDGNECEAGSGQNVFCGCTSDANCGANDSGRICDPTTHKCTSGCSRAPTRNNCPAGQFCTSSDMTGTVTGICTLACNFDVDCTVGGATMPFCIGNDPDANMGHCVECRHHGDCSGMRSVCNPSNACVECTPTEKSACSTTGTGAACLTTGVCGCMADSDCGDVTSGRICDSVSHACAAGCRGMGGNGCPAGMFCSSTTTAVGTCALIVDMATLPDLSVPPDLAEVADLSAVADMGRDAAMQIDAGNETLAGGGFSCAYAAHDGRPGQGAGWFMLLLLVGVGVRAGRRRKY
jgi:hypothetical protein